MQLGDRILREDGRRAKPYQKETDVRGKEGEEGPKIGGKVGEK